MRVLIVEDSERLNAAVARGLRAAGLTVDCAADGESALQFERRYPYEVIVLDLMLSKLSGFEVLRHLRECESRTRVLVLSARDQVTDRVSCLNLGADDYLVKPFAFDELVARVLALGRRRTGETNLVLRVGKLTIDTAARVAVIGTDALPLAPKEYALLETLVRSRGRCMSRAELFERLYDSESESSDRVIEVIVSTLRAKLERAGCNDLIETRRGFGYCVA
jgi:two-component system copper resistance phosphate regulon response regulator CusR